MNRSLLRGLLWLAFFLGFFVVPAETSFVWAQAKEDNKPKRKFSPEEMNLIDQWGSEAKSQGWRRNPGVEMSGRYFGFTKLILLNLLFLGWVATTSWTNNDTQRTVDLNRYAWNWVMISVFPLMFLAALFIPMFLAVYPILILAWLVPVFVYVHHRNVGRLKADKVMTPDHLSFLLKRTLRMNVDPKKAAYETGSPIQLAGWGKRTTEAMRKGRGIAARNQPGYNHAREMIYQAIHRGAIDIRIERGTECRFFLFIDGVWHPADDLFTVKGRNHFTSEDAAPLVAVLKILCGLRSEESAKRQEGEFQALYDVKKKLEAHVVTQGKQGGEEVLIQFQFKALPFHTLEELGMNDVRAEHVKKLLNIDQGLVILSAAPGQGLRTMTNVAFSVADRFTRDFSTVEDIQKPYMPIENIQLSTYDSAKGESPMTVLPDVFFKEPKVLLLRDLVNAETLKLCCEEVSNNRLIMTTFRGTDSVDTILRMLKTGVDPKLLAESLSVVLTQRLVRRLCPACKEAVPANPEILRRLGLPPTIETLYRKRVHAAPEPGQKDTYVPCPKCREIGYLGRAGIYDGIVVNDEIRQIMTTSPSAAALRQAAVKGKNHGYLYDGARMVAAGITSFEELARVLKG